MDNSSGLGISEMAQIAVGCLAATQRKLVFYLEPQLWANSLAANRKI